MALKGAPPLRWGPFPYALIFGWGLAWRYTLAGGDISASVDNKLNKEVLT